jgi:hypothetical protein
MTRTRNTLAALAAAALVAASLSTAAADAAAPGTHSGRATKRPSADKTHHVRRAGGRRPGFRPAGGGSRVVFVVKGTPNGYGPADQNECNQWAGWIDELGEVVEAALNEDDLEGLSRVEEVRDQAIADAEGRGCQITLA